MHRPARLALSLASLCALAACEDPAPPANNTPVILDEELSLSCAREQSIFTLSALSFIVEDLDGAETLRQPSVELLAIGLPVTAEVIPAPTPEEVAAAKESGSEDTRFQCKHESCRVRYTWRRDASMGDGKVFCGDDGSALSVQIAIEDQVAGRATRQVTSTAE